MGNFPNVLSVHDSSELCTQYSITIHKVMIRLVELLFAGLLVLLVVAPMHIEPPLVWILETVNLLVLVTEVRRRGIHHHGLLVVVLTLTV